MQIIVIPISRSRLLELIDTHGMLKNIDTLYNEIYMEYVALNVTVSLTADMFDPLKRHFKYERTAAQPHQ